MIYFSHQAVNVTNRLGDLCLQLLCAGAQKLMQYVRKIQWFLTGYIDNQYYYTNIRKNEIELSWLVFVCLFIRKRHVLIYKRTTSNKVDNTMIQSVHLMYIKSKTVKFEVFGGIYSTAQSGLTYLCHVTQITWRTSQCRIHPQISEQTTFVFLLFFLLSPIFIFLQIKNEKHINYLIKARNWN